MGGLSLLFGIFVYLGASEVKSVHLMHTNWSLSLMALPVAFTAFAYQGIIPTVIEYLDHNAYKVKVSIWLGTLIPLMTYIVWQWLILGIAL